MLEVEVCELEEDAPESAVGWQKLGAELRLGCHRQFSRWIKGGCCPAYEAMTSTQVEYLLTLWLGCVHMSDREGIDGC